jgi:hypothetical protein
MDRCRVVVNGGVERILIGDVEDMQEPVATSRNEKLPLLLADTDLAWSSATVVYAGDLRVMCLGFELYTQVV